MTCPRCGSGPLENDSTGDGLSCSDCGWVPAGRIVLADDGPPRYEGRMTCCGCGRHACQIGEAYCADCRARRELEQ